MNAWQPINTAPTNGNRVLLYYPTIRRPVQIGYYRDHEVHDHGKITYQEKRWSIEGGFGALGGSEPEPSHWMPLPNNPR